MPVHYTKTDSGVIGIIPLPCLCICSIIVPHICFVPVKDAGIVVAAQIIVGCADLENINNGKSLVNQRLTDEPFELIAMTRIPPGDKRCPGNSATVQGG